MMKLFYSAGSCSMSCHITLEEAGVKYEAIELDWEKPSDPNMEQAMRMNPLGTLPVMLTDHEQVLSQNIAIHTYVASLAPESKLLPKAGTPEHAEVMNWLSFAAADLHKAFGPFFALAGISSDPAVQAPVRAWATANVKNYLAHMDKSLAGKDYLTGKDFTVADAYCFVVTNWVQWVGLTLEGFDNVASYMSRVAKRPAVRRVLEQEGMLSETLGAS